MQRTFLNQQLLNKEADNQTGLIALQVVITDSLWPGKFLSFWSRLGAPHPVRLLASEPFPPGTCFTTALHSPLIHGFSVYARCVEARRMAASTGHAGLCQWSCHTAAEPGQPDSGQARLWCLMCSQPRMIGYFTPLDCPLVAA
jgi:hypothetical protein